MSLLERKARPDNFLDRIEELEDRVRRLERYVATASQMLEALKDVDGSGSGLDADLLDGYEASELAALAENETVTGAWTFNNQVNVAYSGTTAVFTKTTVGGDAVTVIGGALRIERTDAGASANIRFVSTDGVSTRKWLLVSNPTNFAWSIYNETTGVTPFAVYGDAPSSSLVLRSGGVGVLTTSPTAPLDVNGDKIRIRTAKTPASATDTGNAGEICWDSNYLYVCVAANTWKRVALSSW